MRTVWQWFTGSTILAAAALAVACSDAPPTSPETAIPSLSTQQIGACARWSCAIEDCTNDPAIYGPCCVDVVDEGQQEIPRPTCGGDEYPGSPGECGPSSYESGEIYAAGCVCDAQYACCYYRNPSSLDPFTCDGTFNY